MPSLGLGKLEEEQDGGGACGRQGEGEDQEFTRSVESAVAVKCLSADVS